MGLKKRVRALEEALERAIQKIEEQNRVIDTLRKEIQLYKNSNTPSSANKYLKPNTFGNQAKKNAKRGALIGHEGKTIKQGKEKGASIQIKNTIEIFE
jgi:hypothetical protein